MSSVALKAEAGLGAACAIPDARPQTFDSGPPAEATCSKEEDSERCFSCPDHHQLFAVFATFGDDAHQAQNPDGSLINIYNVDSWTLAHRRGTVDIHTLLQGADWPLDVLAA